MLILGLDLGTQGARALVVDGHGRIVAQASEAFPTEQLLGAQPGVFEQDMALWRTAVEHVLAASVTLLRKQGHAACEIEAMSVTSTSGTLCLIDAQGEPVRPAIMYSDTRANQVADEVQDAGAAIADKLGTRFGASFALCKLQWIARNEPEALERARWATSPTDVIIGWLTDRWGQSDWTNMLKSGYDVVDLAWPAFIGDRLGLPMDKLPQVVSPGVGVATISAKIAQETGLSTKTQVVSGATDGTASQLASGAVAPGQWNSTLGTTLVLKGVSDTLLRDPQGRLYCHRHPDGYWLPGGASSTGADCLTLRFGQEALPTLNARALGHTPTGVLVYPLMRKGERLPFRDPDAEGFIVGHAASQEVDYAAHLEGIGCVERMCFELICNLGGQIGETINVAGGASLSVAGLQIRADLLGRRLQVPEITAGAMGAAILAARGCTGDSIADIAHEMIRFRQAVSPRPEMRAAYDDQYAQFVGACRERGYLL